MTVRRVPVIPTIVVALVVAAMIALGLWQLLDRLPKKEAFLAQLAGNPVKPAVAFPMSPDDRLLFRRSFVDCRDPRDQQLAGAGGAGYRVIVRCADGVPVQLGTTRDPKATVAWSGGQVDGYISHAPDSRALIATLFDHRPQEMMLIAAAPPAGLAPNRPPDLSAIPNSHLAYAGQWFFFAAIASVIYVLALRRRKGS
ncbi:SURF1 family cytochrome oxidase biogenesis protein [Sphingomonas sp. Tas61C01]|uniref:SURF1 family cytochrome oxidase biogenesis protein n=1 Tax=Sphingomonas sp. Tas61C01 TaxID=3458297 RepID=UPI00403E7241